jgi:ComF family protein
MREAVHALKYNRRRDVVAPLADLLAMSLKQSGWTFDYITGVPLYPAREVERGYNQADLLARETAIKTNTLHQRVLERTRATRDQIGLDGAARRANVHDAFRAHPASALDKSIVLIDDVCTTGATLDACARALFQAGAHRVYGLAVARPRQVPYQNL